MSLTPRVLLANMVDIVNNTKQLLLWEVDHLSVGLLWQLLNPDRDPSPVISATMPVNGCSN